MKNTLLLLCFMAGASVRAQTCPVCSGSATGGAQGDDVGPNFNLSLGAAQYGESAGSLSVQSSVSDPLLFTPVMLQFDGSSRTDVTVFTVISVTTNVTSTVETNVVLGTNWVTVTNFITTVAGIPTAPLTLYNPTGVALDAAGNLYIADTGNSDIREVSPSGVITTVAGNGTLSYPSGVALDAVGNLFIADTGNDVIREVAADGTITTVAGVVGEDRYSGDSGAATNVNLNGPSGVALDGVGNLYIADTDNSLIRKVDTNGILTTVAGNYTFGGGYSGDGGAATSARLNQPTDVAVDAVGNLFIVDSGNNVIRKVATNGIITTVAGDYFRGGTYYGDGLVATNAGLNAPATAALDAVGNLYIGDYANNVIRKVATNGIISTVAGTNYSGAPTYTGDGGAATNARLHGPYGVALDASGNLFIGDDFNYVVREVDTNGIITTVVANGYSGDGGPAINAVLNGPYGVAADGSGDFYIADAINNVIREVSGSGIITTVAGNHHMGAGYSGNGSAATNAMLNFPGGVAVDTSGNFYIADTSNNVIRKVNTSGVISTVAGTNWNSGATYAGNGGTATNARLYNPYGVAVDTSGNLFIADTLNNVIRKVNTSGVISTVAGTNWSGGSTYTGDGGTATNARLYNPYGVAVDTNGNLFIADTLNNVIRKVNTSGVISTVAGTNWSSGSTYTGDGGTATNARLYNPYGVAVDGSGNLYIADTGNNVIRQVTNGVITTLAGNGWANYFGDGGAPTNASFNGPRSLSLNGSGDLYIADAGNNVIREVGPSTMSGVQSYTATEVAVTNVTVVLTTNVAIRQVLAPQTLADVPVPPTANGYVVNFYFPTNITGTNPDGTYRVSGSPFVTWLVTNSNPSATFELQVSEYGVNPAYGLMKQWTYDYFTNAGAWSMTTRGGIQETMVTTNLDASTYQVIDTITNSSGAVVQQAVNTYKIFNWTSCTNVELVTNVIGTGAAARVTTYSYSDPGTNTFTLVNTIIHPDGSWEDYTNYDSLGRATKVYSSFEDAAVNDTTHGQETDYTYDPTNAGVSSTGDNGALNVNTPRLMVRKIQGNEVSRQYTIYPSAGMSLEVQCTVPGAAWNASGNLTTTNNYYTNGPNQFALQAVLRPDGTLSTYNYLTNGTYRTNITVTGQPDSTYSYVVDGVSNIVVLNIFGHNVSAGSYDVASGLLLSRDTNSNFDSYGRPQQVTHLDGTTEYTYYTCCGVNYTSDRDGVTNVYIYDLDNRQLGYAKFYGGAYPISWENTLDPAGRTVKSYRIGSEVSGTTIISSQSAYDSAGVLTAQTNALGGATTYAETIDGTTGGLIRTTTYPNGGTRVEAYYRDGSLKSLTGNAVHGKAYGYGAESISSIYFTYTVETNLNTDGSLSSEWTKTYSDAAGRTTKILYADNSSSQSSYNAQGQLSKQVDPDGDTTLYQYNARGELAFTAVDLNQNGTIDAGSSDPDHITQTTNDVTTDHAATVRRTRTFVWLDGSSSGTPVSIIETSANGLDTWQTQYRDTGTSATNHSHTAPGVSRTVATTNLDNSYTINTYSYGRLASSIRYDSSHTQIGGTTYGYDTQGRQYQITDARNGTTTLGFNNADLVVTNTTPNPGGGSPETTVTTYNNMMQATSVTQPDSTVVSSVYLLTGELGQQSGSRTYPVGYSYDYAGRMQTMTNWSNFGSLAGGRVTAWKYDGNRGWLTNKVYDGGAAGPGYTYTSSGRLKSRVWARGITTSYAYDTAGSLTNVSYSDSTPAATNSYDRLGRLATVKCNGITDTLTYNLANELVGESYSGGLLNGLSVTNGYDADLRRTVLAALASGAPLLSDTYGYDNASRLSTVSDGTDSAVYSYLANSPLVSQIVFKQSSTARMTTTKSYDYLNRLTQISSAPGASYTSSLTFNYNYNPANQRTKDTLADGSYWVYGYDSLGQVTNACKFFADGTPVAGQQFDYAFDTIGNRTQTLAGGDTNGANLRLAAYYANNLNQITNRDVPAYVDVMGASILTNAVTVNGQTAYRKEEYFRQQLAANNSSSPLWTNIVVSGGVSVTGNVYVAKQPEIFKYDPDGNLTNDGRWAYLWDGENRLKVMTVNTNIGPQYQLTFGYDAQGRRIQKIVVTNGVALSTNNFLYDGWNLIAEVGTSGSLVRGYMWGTDLSGSIQGAGGVGGLLEISYSGTNCFPAFDGNGNVAALINAADGTVVANYDYAAFGEPIRITGIMAKNNPFRFSTKYADDESDLLYYGYRYYKPSTGTWPNRDPADEDGGLNLYGFVANDGVNDLDLSGLWKWEGGKRQGGPRATVVADKCQDPYDDLAKLVKLDPAEVKLWLVSYKPNEDVNSGDKFTVPNTVYVDRNVTYPFWWISYAISEVNKLNDQGYFVLYNVWINNDTVGRQFADPDIFGLINVAHGAKEFHGELETSEARGMWPGRIHASHKLGGLKIVQCWGDELPWQTLVSPNGILWAGHGKVRLWNMPGRGF